MLTTEDGRQEQAYNRAASRLVHTYQPRGGLYFIGPIGAPPCFMWNKETQIYNLTMHLVMGPNATPKSWH